METLLLKGFVLLGISLLVACAAGPAQRQNSVPLLHFQKTPCLGTCPSYEATVYTDGRVRYQGYDHVALTDSANFTLSKAELASLMAEIKALRTTPLRDTYLTQWSDMPSTISTFYQNGKEVQSVKHQEGGPDALLQFQEKIHLRLMQLAKEEAYRRLPIK